jgi:hypothetical protein
MSARHTRSGALANDLHNGTCLVPSMGWVGSVMPPGRHRCDCPPDPMGFDCEHEEHRRALGLR